MYGTQHRLWIKCFYRGVAQLVRALKPHIHFCSFHFLFLRISKLGPTLSGLSSFGETTGLAGSPTLPFVLCPIDFSIIWITDQPSGLIGK
jgi:hypothetical protein